MSHPVGHIQIPRFEMDFKSAADNVPGGRRGAISGELSALSANVFHQVDRGEIRMQQRNQRLSHILRTEDVSEPVQRQELRQFLDIRAGMLSNKIPDGGFHSGQDLFLLSPVARQFLAHFP